MSYPGYSSIFNEFLFAFFHFAFFSTTTALLQSWSSLDFLISVLINTISRRNMSKNVLGTKYDKEIRFGSASAAKSWLYRYNFKL